MSANARNDATDKKPVGRSFSIRSRVALAGIMAVGLVAGCGGWAAQAKLSGAIIAQGRVVVKKQVKLVQHRDGGIVAAILVANGDKVEAGDVLVRLDDTQVRSELGVVKAQLAELEGRRARLQAERDGLDSLRFEPGFDADVARRDIARGELRLFADNTKMRQGQREQLLLQVGQFEQQVRGLEAQKQSNAAERQMVGDDLSRLKPLLARKLIEETRTRGMERDLARIDGLGGEIDANIARVEGQISETRLKIIALDQTARTDAQRELRDVDAKLSELEERAIAATDRLSRMDMRASIAGTVNELKVHTLGGVIAPGETVMSLVPQGEELTVEARLAPGDIDQILVHQEARLRFTAFNQRTTPQASGEVATVGAAASTDPSNGQTYYLSEIAITGDMKEFAGKHLVPGMPVEVFFETKERSALSYFAKPFTDQMNRAFREE